MDIKKQKLLIEYLISSSEIFSIVLPIVKSEYFDSEFRNSVKFIKQYYKEFNCLPDNDQILAETDNSFKLHDISQDKMDYCLKEIESFCKKKAIEKAILKSPDLLESGDYGKIEKLITDAVLVSLNKDMGVRYFEEPYKRLKDYLDNSSVISTGWSTIDQYLDGGISKKEMVIFSGNSGVGKSITLSNLCLNLCEQGLNVLYISLELSETMVARRFDSMVSLLNKKQIKENREMAAMKIELAAKKMGEIFIKRLPRGANANDIKSYLKEFQLKHKYIPDVLAVDYLDIMGTVEKISSSDIFTKDKLASEELYELGHEFNMYLLTASQQNRSAVGVKETDQSHIAGGISKINTTDICISLLDYKNVGEIGFRFLKTRSSNGVGKQVGLKWDENVLRLKDFEDGEISLVSSSSIISNDKNKSASTSVINKDTKNNSKDIADLIKNNLGDNFEV